MYYLYLLESVTFKKTYVGITDNLSRRLRQHNNGHHVYTKRYKPWKIKHIEGYKDRKEARKEEKYLKSAAGRRWLKKYIFEEN